MHDAFNELSPELQGVLRSKRAFHDGEQDLRQYGIKLKQGHTYPANDHPVIIRHPDTGQPTLYVNQSFTSHLLDTPSWESSMLLVVSLTEFDRMSDINAESNGRLKP